jgi:prolycopene isomerase
VPFGSEPAWQQDRKGFEEKLLNLAELVLPGLRAALIFRESATPATLARFTMNHGGACYGWAATPRQFGAERLPHITPMRGLYLAGHWTQPAGGVYGAMLSGVQTAGLLAGHASATEFLHRLGH